MDNDKPQNQETTPELVETDIYVESVETDYSQRDIKQVVGEAIAGVNGVLGLKGKLTDIFKQGEDLTRGITLRKLDGDYVDVSAKVIAEAGYNSTELLQNLSDAITLALEEELGLRVGKMDVEIAETLTRAGFYEKYDPERAIH